MLAVNTNDRVQVRNTFRTFPLGIEARPDRELDKLLAILSPGVSWGDRQIAAKKIGYMRNSEAVPGLLAALPIDPFWIVRCAIIQALEMIGDPMAIPTLRDIERKDGFQVVRSYAAKAIEQLSQGN